MPTITVRSQDELDRVLANATADIAVEMGPDAQGLVQEYHVAAPTTSILKVAKGAKLTAHAPDLTVDVEGGIFDGNNKPHHVFVKSGSATAGRGSRVTATGGTFRERGGATDAKTHAHIDNDARAYIGSGVTNVYNKAYVNADGNAEVYAFDNAKVDAFGRANIRADDAVELRAHDHSEAHLHGNSVGYASGPVTMTMVSPGSTSQVGSGVDLRVAESVPHDHYTSSVAPTYIKDDVAKLPDTLNNIRGRGKNAFHRNAPAAPIMDAEVVKLLEGREPGDPISTAVMEAFQDGYRSQADAAAAMSLAVDKAAKSEAPPSPPKSTGSDNHLVYVGSDGTHHYQPVTDIPTAGTLIDPETGEDMEMVGWADSDGGTLRSDDMDLVYRDESGAEHRQSWRDITEMGGLIDPETGEDMEMVDSTQAPCGKCHNTVEDCMCWSGPSFPLTEKVAIVPAYGNYDGPDPGTMTLPAVDGVRPEGAHIAKPDEMLMKVGYKNGAPHTLHKFDWDRGRWGRSMTVVGGPGKAFLTDMERAAPDARKVPEHVAAAYGHATGKCLLCSKPLSDTGSVSRGYGRSCARKLG